jgi:hypothetical protein
VLPLTSLAWAARFAVAMPPKFDPNAILEVYVRATGGEVAAASSLAPKIGPLGLSPKKVRPDAANEQWWARGDTRRAADVRGAATCAVGGRSALHSTDRLGGAAGWLRRGHCWGMGRRERRLHHGMSTLTDRLG